MIPTRVKSESWKVVEDCLQEFHDYSKANARTGTQELRRQIEAAPGDISTDAVYHNEPFDVACSIARRPLELSDHRDRYDAVLDWHRW